MNVNARAIEDIYNNPWWLLVFWAGCSLFEFPSCALMIIDRISIRQGSNITIHNSAFTPFTYDALPVISSRYVINMHVNLTRLCPSDDKNILTTFINLSIFQFKLRNRFIGVLKQENYHF